MFDEEDGLVSGRDVVLGGLGLMALVVPWVVGVVQFWRWIGGLF